MRGRSRAFLLLLSSFQIFCSFVLLFFFSLRIVNVWCPFCIFSGESESVQS